MERIFDALLRDFFKALDCLSYELITTKLNGC